MQTIKCSCGKILRLSTITDFDFSPFAGLSCILETSPGYSCSCGAATIDGEIIKIALDKITRMLLENNEPLNTNSLKFLRKSVRLSKQALAIYFSVSNEMIDKFEAIALNQDLQKKMEIKLKNLAKANLCSNIINYSAYPLVVIKLQNFYLGVSCESG